MWDKIVKQKELIKTVSITVLVTGILFFIAGIKAHERYQAGVERQKAKVAEQVKQIK